MSLNKSNLLNSLAQWTCISQKLSDSVDHTVWTTQINMPINQFSTTENRCSCAARLTDSSSLSLFWDQVFRTAKKLHVSEKNSFIFPTAVQLRSKISKIKKDQKFSALCREHLLYRWQLQGLALETSSKVTIQAKLSRVHLNYKQFWMRSNSVLHNASLSHTRSPRGLFKKHLRQDVHSLITGHPQRGEYQSNRRRGGNTGGNERFRSLSTQTHSLYKRPSRSPHAHLNQRRTPGFPGLS